MLRTPARKSAQITRVERVDNALFLYSVCGMHRIQPFSERCAHVTYTERESFSERVKPGVIATLDYADWQVLEAEDVIRYVSSGLIIEINRASSSMTYFDGEGRLLFAEASRTPKTMEEYDSYILSDEEAQTEKVQTADGVKEKVIGGEKRLEGRYCHTRWSLRFSEGEALYGLGQHEEGNLNLRGKTVYSHQANRKIEIPFLVSTNGYGILYDTYAPLIFRDNEFGSYLYAEADDEMDYYVIADASLDGVIRVYRQLTGKAAMLPKWAFGYVQSRERYQNAEEILSTIEEFRRRKIGLDLLVLDWHSWPKDLWGQKTFDPERFPDPRAMMDAIHEKKAHLMVSIWPNMHKNAPDYAEMKAHKAQLPVDANYNAYSEEGRRIYWSQLERGLYADGVDAWWCDSSEPYAPEWLHTFLPEPNETYREYVNAASAHIPAWKISAYALYHARAIYEGQRGVCNTRRVLNLTRSGYTGQQRYGTVLWSGDVSASWETMRRQIAGGLSFSASGLPYWTVDIGAFFVKYGKPHYWSGEYDNPLADAGYRELYTRWLQWGAFLPVFRSHGTDCYREPWQFEEDGVTPGGNMFYEAILAAIRQRYRLMPYIYSQAGAVYHDDDSFIKPLAFLFPEDKEGYDIKDQYMFGDALMVCPVTTPMYFTHGSTSVEGVEKTREVYLPAGTDWYDYRTERKYRGGQRVVVPAPIDSIPIFVRAGSILPVTTPKEHTEVVDDIEYLVYAGADGSYTLYTDDGEGYAYESGAYTKTHLTWDNGTGMLFSDSEDELVYRVISE